MDAVVRMPFGFLAQVAFSSDEDAREWEHHLFTEVGQLGDGCGMSFRNAGDPLAVSELNYPHYEVRAANGPGSALLLVPTDAGVAAFVASPSWQDEVPVWAGVINRTTALTGKTDRNFEWQAVIDARPHQFGWVGGRLAAPGSVGGLVLEPSEVVFLQAVPNAASPSRYMYQEFVSCPIVVRGQATAYSWEAASLLASEALHRLLCTIAVAWDRPWDVVDAPQVQAMAPPVATSLAWQRESRTAWSDLDTPEPESVRIPTWASAAWSLLEQDPVLLDAASGFLEGLRFESNHPSWAQVAFVASIEGAGQGIDPPERCSDCGQVKAATGRFRQAAASVATSEHESAVIKAVVQQRNLTAHQGRLHGADAHPGSLMSGRALAPPDQRWQLTSGVNTLRALARRLLLNTMEAAAPV